MSTDSTISPERIKAIRIHLGESTATFAERFARSGRTVEDWEQGRRNPDKLAVQILLQLEPADQKPSRKKGSKKVEK